MNNVSNSKNVFWYATDINNENPIMVTSINKIPKGYIIHVVGSVYSIIKYLKNRG